MKYLLTILKVVYVDCSFDMDKAHQHPMICMVILAMPILCEGISKEYLTEKVMTRPINQALKRGKPT